MSILLVDIGNTRVKWQVLRGTRRGLMQALPHGKPGAALRSLVRRAPRDVERIVVVSVAGNEVERAFTAAARDRLGITPEFVRSARRSRGITNGYRDTWRLGADRWVAAIGAHHLARGRAVLIANVGTALTVDAVSANGRHLGGAIIPGPETMVASLLSGTHGIRRRAQGVSAGDGETATRSLFARDTRNALRAGSLHAAAALIDRAHREASKGAKPGPLLILTGGGAAPLRALLSTPSRLVPDLVLRGLAEIARDSRDP